MWFLLSVGSVHQDFFEVMAKVLSVLCLEKYVFTGTIRSLVLVIGVACRNYFPEQAEVSINL